MPPVVRVTGKVDLSNEPALGDLRNVNEECNYNQDVHSDDTRNKNLEQKIIRGNSRVTSFRQTHINHCVFASTHRKVPMNCRNNSKRCPWHEHCHFDVVLNFQSGNLHYHWNHEDDKNCRNVKVAKNLEMKFAFNKLSSVLWFLVTLVSILIIFIFIEYEISKLITNWTYAMTPKSVVNSANVNRKQWQGDSKKIVSQKAVVICLRSAAEDVIEWREAHADLEAHEESADNQLIDEMCMNLQESYVVNRKCNKQKQAEYVRPYVDLWKDFV